MNEQAKILQPQLSDSRDSITSG